MAESQHKWISTMMQTAVDCMCILKQHTWRDKGTKSMGLEVLWVKSVERGCRPSMWCILEAHAAKSHDEARTHGPQKRVPKCAPGASASGGSFIQKGVTLGLATIPSRGVEGGLKQVRTGDNVLRLSLVGRPGQRDISYPWQASPPAFCLMCLAGCLGCRANKGRICKASGR